MIKQTKETKSLGGNHEGLEVWMERPQKGLAISILPPPPRPPPRAKKNTKRIRPEYFYVILGDGYGEIT